MNKFAAKFAVWLLCSLLFFPSVSGAQEKELMRVVAKEKNGFTRVLFYSEQPVRYSQGINGQTFRINFEKAYRADFNDVLVLLGKNIISASQEDDGRTIKIGLKQDRIYKSRSFLGKNFVGVDLYRVTNPRVGAISSSSDKPREALVKKPQSSPPAPRLRQEFVQTAAVSADAETDGQQNTNQDASSQDSEQPEQPLADVLQTPDQETSSQISDNNESNQPIPAQPEELSIDTVLPESVETQEVVVKDITELKSFPTKTNITFEWQEEVGAAVFTRGDYLWIVFDQAKEIDVQQLADANQDYFDAVEQLENRHYTIIRAMLKGPTNVISYKEDNNWVVAITHDKVVPLSSPEINIAMSELHGSTVVIPSSQRTKPIRFIDPTIGDEIIAVPFVDEGSGMDTTFKYTDFVIIKSVQGVAVQLVSDSVEVTLSDKKIGLVGPANRLAGSAQSALRELQEREREAKLRAERLKQQATELALIKFKTWSKGGTADYRENFNQVKWAVTETDWGEKGPKRLDVARFYFAHGLASEALGVTRMIKEYDEEYANTNDVKIVEGAALYMMGRYSDASEVFDAIDYAAYTNEQEIEEARFWRAATNIHLDQQIKMDQFIARNPLEEEKKSKANVLDSGDKVEITRLMLETSSRLLKMIRKIDPDFANSNEVQTLESTARFVVDHYQEAIARFEETDLFRSGDVFEAEEDKLWWSTSSSRRGMAVEFPFLANKDRFLKYYPSELYNDFALLALEDRIRKNDLGAAEEILQIFREDDKRVRLRNSVEFLRGLFYAKDEEPLKAIESWTALSKNVVDRYNRTRATFALTVLQLQRKEIGLDDAIASFNTIRSTWRGGVLEMNILKLLGEFYMDKKNYMDGFKVWRQIVSDFPGSEEALLIAKRMSDKFVQIFNQGDSEELDQLKALTLYYEFRELTPIGKLGDEMIGRLADRLIDVDLLERAAALLTHQVRFRLSGEAKDRAVIKLVKIHLANQAPQAAFDVLNATDVKSDIDEIMLEKKYLQATTLIELGKNNQALSLLRGDDNHTAYFLRADVYWREKIWKKVIVALETPFRDLRREERMLTKEEISHLLRLAVAYAVVERKKRLQILYEDFVNFVDHEEKKQILTFVASDRGPVDYKDIEYSVGYDDMESFLDQYLQSGKQDAAMFDANLEDQATEEEES